VREIKEQGLLDIEWCESEDMPADLFTKNLGGEPFQKHVAVFCGQDVYS
jgi:hypothetical protein